MDKRERVLKKIGAQRRKEKRKQALLDAGSDRKQQKLCFSPSTYCESRNNNDLLHGENASSSTESTPGEARDNETLGYVILQTDVKLSNKRFLVWLLL
jgi:hypothetical protein